MAQRREIYDNASPSNGNASRRIRTSFGNSPPPLRARTPELTYEQGRLQLAHDQPGGARRDSLFDITWKIDIYAFESYIVESKPPMPADPPQSELLRAMRRKFASRGLIRSVFGVIVVYYQGLPHVLLLKKVEWPMNYTLPGGELDEDEAELDGLKRLLDEILGPAHAPSVEWRIEHIVGSWWRPDFGSTFYPCAPAGVARPKENKRIFLVQLPIRAMLHIPSNYELVAMPLRETHAKPTVHDAVILSLPQTLRRFDFIFNP